LYSHVRFITAASLIAFGGLIGIGVPALLVSKSERLLVAKADGSDPTVAPCKRQTWLQLDRNCLSRHELPWFAGRGTTNGHTTEVRAEPERTIEQPSSEGRAVTTAPQEPAPPVSAAQSSIAQEFMTQDIVPQEFGRQHFVLRDPVPRKSTPPAFVLQGLTPQESESNDFSARSPTPQESVQQGNGSPPAAKRTLRGTAAERRAAKPVTEAQASLPTAKKPIRGSRIAKRSTNEALSVVQRFGDSPRDTSANAFAGNGARPGNRTRVGSKPGMPLDIRPTSIQDVYYYSAPR
jgi:hypothetical protein